jgi:hypothetical protein
MPRIHHKLFLVLGAMVLPYVAPAQSLDLDAYDALLEEHARSVPDLARTRVDYAAIAADPNWKKLVESLAASKPGSLERRFEKLAFWINAYNILAIDLVANYYPIESIKDIGSVFNPVWKKPAGRIDGKDYSLDEIEHGIVRPMGDPRAHAAVVCASTSCPALRREAWRAEMLDAQLDDAMRLWVRDTGKGLAIDRARAQITLSRIFDWFEEDFAPFGGAIAFVSRYASDEDRAWLSQNASSTSIRYFDYDWRVNASR